jgi:hypothetical protein
MAILWKTDGTSVAVTPCNPKKGFTLEELYSLLSCDMVQTINGPRVGERRTTAVLDEESKMKEGIPLNDRATRVFREGNLIFPNDYILGDVLLVFAGELK